MATNTADANWSNTGTQQDCERGLSVRNDCGKNNSTIAVCTLHGINEDNNGPYRSIEMYGGGRGGGVICTYTIWMNRHGILCDCPHNRTCKHCIYVLRNVVGVPVNRLLSTSTIKQKLCEYFDSRFVVISDSD